MCLLTYDIKFQKHGGFNNLFSKIQLCPILSFITNDDDDDGEVEGDHDY